MVEIITTIMGLIQGGLVWANKRSNWIFYCLQYIFLGIFSFTAHLYGDITNSIFYFCVGITGWIFWNKNKGDTPIRKCKKKERIGYSVIIVVSTIIVYYFLMKTDDPLPLNEKLLKEDDIRNNWEELNVLEQKVLQYIYDKGEVTNKEICEYIDRTRRTTIRILNRLEEKNLIEWIGTSVSDTKKVYTVKQKNKKMSQ